MLTATSAPDNKTSKKSFLKLPVSIDVERLRHDYSSIPAVTWATSHWDTHCSSEMLLLRGGQNGKADDFVTDDVSNAEILAKLPYFAWLIDEVGPFGGAKYAFLFRMKPKGVSRHHRDKLPAWWNPFRIHIPIFTNHGASLLCERRAMHFPVGEVWTFDNQAMHAVVNGDTVRAHLIIDVEPNPKLDALLANAIWNPGVEDLIGWEASAWPNPTPIFKPVEFEPLSSAEKMDLGLRPESFATKIIGSHLIARLVRYPLKQGDIIVSVDDETESHRARTAFGYLDIHYQIGQTVHLGVIRDGKRITVKMTLIKDAGTHFPWAAMLKGITHA
jgi:hypothetical protein